MPESTPQKIGSADDTPLAELEEIDQPNVWQSALLEGEVLLVTSIVYVFKMQFLPLVA
ncbi:hypothetical protein H6F76_10835 [Leptolyngbya sp. FACHB-321]|uniref:hypothetical protein n=1 Tax=Leptolyngbya sp. FACHB-321 TaxID=2692807 RepID=UPI001683BDE4|nr:hypothetical protein [Leptolyngbya sp. FACHB-321]MBD2035513.1 hypothetical protein [Leptolyngbya sp. FACHB-321]